MLDTLGAVLRLDDFSNNILILQLQSIATTSCNATSYNILHIPQIAALEAFTV